MQYRFPVHRIDICGKRIRNVQTGGFLQRQSLADFRNLLALTQFDVRLAQLRDNLVHRMTFLLHLKESLPGLRPDWILTLFPD